MLVCLHYRWVPRLPVVFTESLHIALAGLFFQLTVIVGVGPQNIVLLRQGVRRWGVGLVVAVCTLGDLILLPVGTAGVSVVVERMPVLLEILRWGGVAYLLWFASTCLRDVRHPTPIDTSGAAPGQDASQDAVPAVSGDTDLPTGGTGVGGTGGTAVATLPARTSVRSRAVTRLPALAALPTALAVTFLNPAAYVDGMVVFGSMANQYDDAGKWVFTTGALVASTLFFICIGYGARLLSRPLSSVRVWRWINLGIGVLMIGMAARLAMMG
jgi:L-lysine exporter family protein LysE/ArgO